MRTLLLLLTFTLSVLAADESFPVVLQSRNLTGKKLYTREQWLPSKTAMIVCDMWDRHTSPNAMKREGEIAPRMNELLEKARGQGILIIHAPSSCMKSYEGHPARLRAQSAPTAARLPDKIAEWCKQIPTEEQAIYPLDQSDGGSDDDPAVHAAWAQEVAAQGLNPKAPWTKQIDVLRIDPATDAISDSGIEIWNLLEARQIDNVILMGVHTNMCVSGRPFGLRQMAKNGKHVALMRDLTDTMYNPQRWPFVSHQRGTELYIQHVEKRICPTLSSDQFLGGQPFTLSQATAGKKRLQILLLGDSTTEAKFPKLLAPDEPQLEDSLRILLASEPDLPPTDVHNEGLSGEYIRRLLDTRYDQAVKDKPQADYIFIRYGINDMAKRESFDTQFVLDYAELISRLRRDHPQAQIIPMTVIPYGATENNQKVNHLIQQVARQYQLPLFNIYPAYASALKAGPNMLNYRRMALSKIPAPLQALVTPYVQPGTVPEVVVLDNRLDAHLGHLPGWYGDRHPNLAGYQVIASETAKFLAPRIRQRK